MKYLCEGCSRLVTVGAFRASGEALVLICPACGAQSKSDPAPRAIQPSLTEIVGDPPLLDFDLSGGSAAVDDPALLPTAPAAPRPPALPKPAAAVSAAPGGPTLVERVRKSGGARERAGASSFATSPLKPLRRTREVCPKCGAARKHDDDACPRCGLVYALFNPAELELPPAIEKLWVLAERSTELGPHLAFLDAATRAAVLPEAALRYRVFAEQHPEHPQAARMRDEAAGRLLAISALPEHSALRVKGGGARRSWVRPVLALLLIAALAATTYAFFVTVGHRAPPSPPLP